MICNHYAMWHINIRGLTQHNQPFHTNISKILWPCKTIEWSGRPIIYYRICSTSIKTDPSGRFWPSKSFHFIDICRSGLYKIRFVCVIQKSYKCTIIPIIWSICFFAIGRCTCSSEHKESRKRLIYIIKIHLLRWYTTIYRMSSSNIEICDKRSTPWLCCIINTTNNWDFWSDVIKSSSTSKEICSKTNFWRYDHS